MGRVTGVQNVGSLSLVRDVGSLCGVDDVRKRGRCGERCEHCERRAQCGLCRPGVQNVDGMVGAGGVCNVVRMNHVSNVGYVPSLSGVSSGRNVQDVDSLRAMWVV